METKITYLGGATYLIEIGSFRLLTDPGFDAEGTERSEGPGHDLKKVMSPPIAAEDIGDLTPRSWTTEHCGDDLP